MPRITDISKHCITAVPPDERRPGLGPPSVPRPRATTLSSALARVRSRPALCYDVPRRSRVNVISLYDFAEAELALVACPQCANRISTSAYACPQCGCPTRPVPWGSAAKSTLIDCPECSKQFSSRAPACPGCGYPTGRINWATIGRTLLLWVVFIVFFLILFQFLSPGRH